MREQTKTMPGKTRVLQVVWTMQTGGIENWLMEVLRRIDKSKLQVDFLVQEGREGTFDAEIRELGSRIFPCPSPTHFWKFRPAFRKAVERGGPYDVVHCHRHHSGAIVLREAAKLGTPIRIAHAHNDLRARPDSLHSRMIRPLFRKLVRRYSTDGIAASSDAAGSLFGNNWRADSRFRLLFCGIDFLRFSTPCDRNTIRREFGIDDNGTLVVNVGRFVEQKNHALIMETARVACKREPNVHFLLIGSGPLESEMKRRAQEYGLTDRVHFAGLRSDVPDLLRASDAFLFPSLHEGLGLALVEAQAAGLPCVISDTIPHEATVVDALVTRCSLHDSACFWAETLTRSLASAPVTRGDALHQCLESQFAIERSVHGLEALYAGNETVDNRKQMKEVCIA